jgi:hypothetical protein
MKLRRFSKINYAATPSDFHGMTAVMFLYNLAFVGLKFELIRLTPKCDRRYCGINSFTPMPPAPEPNAKRRSLQESGTFNPRSAQVRHPLFEKSDFFDPEDLLQLKYETLRTLEQEDYSIAQAAQEFGLSRPTIYQAQADFEHGGRLQAGSAN